MLKTTQQHIINYIFKKENILTKSINYVKNIDTNKTHRYYFLRNNF